ncbi:transcription factor TFIIIC subunit TFC3 [Sugiyamaella lignohabitans]|uniref:Transcription factor TFIIIC subunit TFC3 n=1 Tax=Sugiyamaella lignohabitans TaxID=796027 RepID=A0A167FDX7_9ASCO|nr:transcription factor TFIIIC subunit TFC3 [Sugiyamaella lignohabitans]ANB15178.1 transcription factor TFIIIC subunit TFC3 [Sugiyamaella lignohabitans]
MLSDLGLVQRFPMLSKGITTHLVVYRKFITGNRKDSSARGAAGVDIIQLRNSIVSAVKEARNGLRQHQELKVQLGFEKTHRQFVIFARAVRVLESQGYVKRVIVHTQSDKGEKVYKVRCIKFVKDLPESDDKGDLESDLSDDSDFAEIDEEPDADGTGTTAAGATTDTTSSKTSTPAKGKIGQGADSNVTSGTRERSGDSADAPDVSQIDSSSLVKIYEDGYIPDQSDKKYIFFNQFYPLENQIYDCINSGGEFGIPAMDLGSNLVGSNYSRIFARILDTLSDKPATASKSAGKKKKPIVPPKNLEHLTIIRGIDFSARMKFYRYFSQPGYFAYGGKTPEENWGTWKEINLTGAAKSLRALDKKLSSALPGLVEVRQDNEGNVVPLFHGEKGKIGDYAVINAAPRPPETSTGKKKGRPRKSDVAVDPNAPPRKRGRPRKDKSDQPPVKLSKSGKVRATRASKEAEVKIEEGVDRASAESVNIQEDMLTQDAADEAAAALVGLRGETSSQTSSAFNDREQVMTDGEEERDLDQVSTDVTPIDNTAQNNVDSAVVSRVDVGVPVQPTSPHVEGTTSIKVKAEPDDDHSANSSIYTTPVPDIPVIPTTPSLTPGFQPEVREGPTVDTPAATSTTGEQINSTAPSESGPTPGDAEELANSSNTIKRYKPKPKAPSSELSFALIKRKAQIMSILEDKNGVVEGGTHLQNLIAAKFSEKEGSTIDRKTVQRVVTHMLANNDLHEILLSVPKDKDAPAKGSPGSKQILFLPSIDPDCEEIRKLKASIAEGVKKRAPTILPVPRISMSKDDLFVRHIRASRLKQVDSTKVKSRKSERSRPVAVRREPRVPPTPREVVPPKSTADAERPAKARRVSKKESAIDKNILMIRPYNPPSNEQSTSVGGEGYQALEFLPNYVPPKPQRRHKNLDPVTGRIRRSLQKGRRSKVDNERLYRVVIIVRSMFSTSLGSIDWEKVVTAFPNMLPSTAKSKWPSLRDRYGGRKQVGRAMKRWEDLFLKSYENGELPLVHDNDYDVGFYADFWKANENELEISPVPWLLDNDEGIEQGYELVSIEADHARDPIDLLYYSTSMVKTDELMTQSPFGYDPASLLPETSPTDKAKQAVKGTIATSHRIYDANISKDILLSHGAETSIKAVKELEADRSIVYLPRDKEKVLPGRNYLFSDKFNAQLDLRIGNGMFHEATEFENKLISTFESSKGMIMSRTAPDSSLVALLDLICYRKVDLVRINTLTNIMLSGYTSRIIDKEKLDSDIIIRGLLSHEESLTKLVRPEIPPPLGSGCQYIWTSVIGTLNEDIWARVLKQILMVVTFRPGISSVALHRKMSLVLTYEETTTALKWLCERECIRVGEYDAHFILPRWYSNIFA